MNTVDLPIPPSTNHLWKSVHRNGRTRVVLTPEYEAWKSEAVLLVRTSLARVAHYPVVIRVVVYGGKGWRANRDIDNVLKPILDSLVTAERIAGDDTRYVREVVATFEPTNQSTRSAICRVIVEALR
jgi:Holliday junction resolvase RusA-like endonuclease